MRAARGRSRTAGARADVAPRDAAPRTARPERHRSPWPRWTTGGSAPAARRAPGARTARRAMSRVDAARSDVRPGEDDLGMMLGERARFRHERVGRATAIRAARERRRAEGAVLIAAVLDAQERARCRWCDVGSSRTGDADRARRSRRDRRPAITASTVGSERERGERSHGSAAAQPMTTLCSRRIARRGAAHRLSQIALRLARHRAAVEHRDVGVVRRRRRSRRPPPRPSRAPSRCRTGSRGSRRCGGTASRARRRDAGVADRVTALDARRWLRRQAEVERAALPSPVLFTQMRPPCASTTSLQKARPSPELRTRGMCGVFTCSNFRKMMS